MPKMFEVKVHTNNRSSIGTFICLKPTRYTNGEEVKVVISTYRYYIILFDVPDLIPPHFLCDEEVLYQKPPLLPPRLSLIRPVG